MSWSLSVEVKVLILHFTGIPKYPEQNMTSSLPVSHASAPSSWDWTDHGIVSPIKNQKQCGSCAAFAAVAIRDWPGAPPETETSREHLRQILDGVGQALKTRHVLKIASAGISLSTGSLFLGLWGGPYLNDVHSLTETERGEVLMFMALAGVTGHFAFGKLARALNTLKGIVLFGSGLAAVVMATMALWIDPSRLVVTLLFGVLGLGLLDFGLYRLYIFYV